MSNVLQQIASAGTVKTTVPIDLGDCDEAYRGVTFDVWVTPTRAHWAAFSEYNVWLVEEPKRKQAQRDAIEDEAKRAEFDRVMGEKLEREMYRRLDAWLAETWVNIPAGEVTTIRETLQENYPDAWDWLYGHTLRAMRDYRENLSKN